ncbi:hypothetical protein IV102_35275 [bacterium]|nr:hypothetical protein [bacterium]
MRFLAVLVLLFTLSVAQGRTLGEAGEGQIEIPDTWVSYQGVWLNPEQTLCLDFRTLGSKGDLARFAESARSRLVEQGGDRLLTDTRMRSLGGCQVASWRSMSKMNCLTLNYLISKKGKMLSLTLAFVQTPSEAEMESLESQLLNSLRWP